MNPPNDPKTKHQSLPYTPDADTSPQSATPDRTEPGADGTGIRFGPPAAAGEIGTLGRFRIKKELGRGGMGAVFLALDTRLERQIALKVMLPQAAANKTAKDRFIREARAAARISHDNVIAILDADELDGVPYIALPYLQGYPLDQFLKKKGNPSISQAMRMGREMALGLAAAHDLGIVHRDIKPGNVWLEAPNGRVKILDFGLAKPQDEEAGKELTHSGAVMGTPAYMAPEQAAGLKVDHRADLYSLGTVLYRLVTGRTPFERPGGMMSLLTALAIELPPRVEDFNADVPPALAELIHQLLHKDREQRPQSAKEVAKRLAAVRDNPAVPDVSLAPSQPQAYVPVPITLGSQSNAFADIDADEATQREPRRKDPTAVLPVAKANRKPLFAMLGVGFLVVAVGGYFLSKMLRGPAKVPEVVEKKPTVEEPPKKDPTPRSVPNPPPPPAAAPIRYDAWVPVTEFTPVKAAPRGPLDDLDRAKISATERMPGQPRELVAVAGSHFGLAESHYRFFPDGKRFVTMTHSGGLKVFETETLKLRYWDRTQSGGWSLALSPDGRALAACFAFANGIGIQVYDATGAVPVPVRRIAIGGNYYDMAFVDGSRTLATLEPTKGIKLWDVADTAGIGTHIVKAEQGEDYLKLGVSQDGKTLAALLAVKGQTNQVRVWDLEAGSAKLRCTISAEENPNSFVLSVDGRRMVTGHATKMSRWKVDGDTPTEMATEPEPVQVRETGFGKDEFISWNSLGATKLWTFQATLQKIRDLPPNTVAVSPDETRIVQCEGGSIHRVRGPVGNFIAESGEAVATATASPALGQGLFTFALDQKGRYWSVREGSFRPSPVEAGGPAAGRHFFWPAVSPDGLAVAGRIEGGPLAVFAVQGDGVRIVESPAKYMMPRYAWAPDGKTIYFTNNADGSVHRWKPFEAKAEPEAIVDLGFGPNDRVAARSIAVAPSGKLLAVVTPRGVELLDLANEPTRPKENWIGVAAPKVRRTLVPDSDPEATTLAFSPGNRFLYFNAAEKTIRRVDLSHPQLASNDVVAEAPLLPHRFEFAADAKILVTTSGPTFKWWDTATEPFKLLGSYTCSNAGTHWQLAPDGRHLLIVEHGAAYVLRLATPSGAPYEPPPVPAPPVPMPPVPVPVPPKAAAVPPRWLELTDGKTLADWDQFVTKGWTLKNGILEADGSAQGWIGTKKDYTDFELELEYRLPPKGNSGVFLRAWDNGRPTGAEFVEIQLLDDAAYPMTVPNTRHGAVFKKVAPNPVPRFKVNQWNPMKVTVVGKRVTVAFNDVKCIDAEVEFTRAAGRVGLQHYQTGAEFRNVRIREK